MKGLLKLFLQNAFKNAPVSFGLEQFTNLNNADITTKEVCLQWFNLNLVNQPQITYLTPDDIKKALPAPFCSYDKFKDIKVGIYRKCRNRTRQDNGLCQSHS